LALQRASVPELRARTMTRRADGGDRRSAGGRGAGGPGGAAFPRSDAMHQSS
jgi:hypothetical protein